MFISVPVVSGTVASTTTSGLAPTTSESKYGSSSSLASEQPLRYQTPSQSSFANAVHCYTQKLTTNRPRSASTSGQRPGTLKIVTLESHTICRNRSLLLYWQIIQNLE